MSDSEFVPVRFIKTWTAQNVLGEGARHYAVDQVAELRVWLALRLFQIGIVHPI